MNSTHSEVLIVGAGLSGLLAARVLQQLGQEVIVVDKGRSVGGRLATRRIGPGRADHGAQFFTVRTPEFRSWVDRWLAAGLVYQWSTGWSDGSLDTVKPDGYPRYAIQAGMNNLAKHLAQDLTIELNVRIEAVMPTASGWQLQAEAGQLYTSEVLILTPPVPQALALLDAGGTPLSAADRQALARITYAPCLAGLFWLEDSIQLPEPGAIQRLGAPISWIANNQQKGISPEASIVTVHAGPAYSRQLWGESEATALAYLQAALQPFLGPTAKIVEAQLKRWRYALPTVLHPERCLVATELPTLVFSGDAFGGPRLEGAALSGLAAAAVVEARLAENEKRLPDH